MFEDVSSFASGADGFEVAVIYEVFEPSLEAAAVHFGEDGFGLGYTDGAKLAYIAENIFIFRLELTGGVQDAEIEDADFGVKDAHRSEEAVGKIFQPRREVGFDGGAVVFAVD